jgi:ParB family chromosome partitioning protein
VYACSDPQSHGHRNRYGTDGENKLPEEAKAERRDVIENNKAWRAAEPVRREYIRTLLTSNKVPKGTLRFVTTEIMADPTSFGHGPDDLIADLAHITKPTSIDTTPSWHRTAGPAFAAKASDARLPLVLLAQLAAAREQSMDVYSWRKPSPTSEARWLTYLAGTGYALADIEQRVIDIANTRDDDDSEPAEPDNNSPADDDAVATGDTSDAA